MKIVFIGSSEFAGTSLERLVLEPGHKIAAVVTQPDKRQGRRLCMQATPVKDRALRHGLAVFQPEDINSSGSVKRLGGLDADCFVVIAYGQKLSPAVLDLPQRMAVNIHASLLPRYRGAAPINWALINGEKSTGVTSMKMVERMDAGPILLQQEVPISPQDNACTLERALAEAGSRLLIHSLRLIETGQEKLIEQDESMATHAPKMKKSDGLIDWSQPAQKVVCRVAGCQPWPGAFTYYKGRALKLFSVHRCPEAVLPASAVPGEIVFVSKHSLQVCCPDGACSIEEVQPEGGKRMTITEFVAGHKVRAGERFLLH